VQVGISIRSDDDIVRLQAGFYRLGATHKNDFGSPWALVRRIDFALKRAF
jgi:hypothetical protein